MSSSIGRSTLNIPIGILPALAWPPQHVEAENAPPSTSHPTCASPPFVRAPFSTMNAPPTPVPMPQLIDKKPVWKISPASGKYYVNSVAVSADGGRVVGGTFYHYYPPRESRRAPAAVTPPPPSANSEPSPDDGTFGTYCYDARGQLRWKDEFQGWQGVYWVALSADGSRAAAGGFMAQSATPGFVRAYDADGGRLMLSQSTKKRVNQVALSGDGTWLVSAAETLLLFRSGLPSYVQKAEFTSPGAESIVSASLSRDGSTVVYSDFAGWIGVLANHNGTLTPLAQWKVPVLSKEGNFCHMIDLAPDGKTFAAGGSGGQFYFFEIAKFIATQQPTHTCNTGVAGAVYGVAGAPDGSLFAGMVNSGETGQAYPVAIVNGAAAPVPPLALKRNPNSAALNVTDGNIRLAIADGHPDGTPGHYYLFSGPAGAGPPLLRLRWIFETGNMSWPIAIAANGGAVVGGSDDSHLYYFTP